MVNHPMFVKKTGETTEETADKIVAKKKEDDKEGSEPHMED